MSDDASEESVVVEPVGDSLDVISNGIGVSEEPD